MAKQQTSPEEQKSRPELVRAREKKFQEIQALYKYALSRGVEVPEHIKNTLASIQSQAEQQGDSNVGRVSGVGSALDQIYSTLVRDIHPAQPSTIMAMEESKNSSFRFLGPIPLVRKMMIMTIIFLITFLALFISPDVDSRTINGDILSYPSQKFLLNQLFILCIAGLGASFYALFEAYKYVTNSSFDDRYESIYWIRFVLGIVSGVILAQFIFISPEALGADPSTVVNNMPAETGGFITYKPLLAFLGGFSSTVVHKILNSLVDSVETFITGSARDAIRAREQIAQVQLEDKIKAIQQENEGKDAAMRLQSAMYLMELKQKMASGDLNDAELQASIDTLMNNVVSPVEKKTGGASFFGTSTTTTTTTLSATDTPAGGHEIAKDPPMGESDEALDYLKVLSEQGLADVPPAEESPFLNTEGEDEFK